MDFPKKRKTEENGDANSPQPATTDAVASTTSTLTAEDIRKILQPFTQEQLLELLQSASLRHPDVLDAVRSVADRDSTQRKLFVRGLSLETTTETLRRVFSAFGELDEAIVIFDKSTGRSKGYGFVVFRHVDGAMLALKEPSKKIDGRITVTQLAAAGGPGGGVDVSARKVFVGNVPFEISSERLLSVFQAFGEIEEGPLGFDKASGKPRGFAFFVYKTEEGARASLVEPTKTIDGHQVICKLAVDNKKPKQPSGFAGDHQQQMQHHQQPPSMHAPMLVSHYGGYGSGAAGGANSYGMPPSGMLPSVPPQYNNPVRAGGGYGHSVGGGYGNSQYGGPISGDYGASVQPNSGGGYPDGSQYGYPSQPAPMPRPPPGGMYQGVPPPYY